jgi:hypothetical protein
LFTPLPPYRHSAEHNCASLVVGSFTPSKGGGWGFPQRATPPSSNSRGNPHRVQTPDAFTGITSVRGGTAHEFSYEISLKRRTLKPAAFFGSEGRQPESTKPPMQKLSSSRATIGLSHRLWTPSDSAILPPVLPTSLIWPTCKKTEKEEKRKETV